jgi:very-short-patch-repair endonuclease
MKKPSFKKFLKKRKLLGISSSTPKKKKEKDKRFDSPIEEKFYYTAKEMGLELICKYRVGNYTLDFAYKMKNGNILGLECDGKAYHLKETEQFNRDYYRSRWILKNHGIVIVRFTGSQIYNECKSCISDVIAIIEKLEG